MRPMRRGKLACALSLGALAGCSASPASSTAPYACLLPFEQRMLVAELFFGRGIAGGAPLTDAEWAEFAARTIAPNFADGFTVFDGEGRWRNPPTGYAVGERTKILIVAATREPDLARRIGVVMDAYKTRFRQLSVGIITRDSCAAF